jgi:hypothetical protein
MYEINDIEIRKLPIVLTKETTTQRNFSLIDDADINCEKIIAAGFVKGSDLLNMDDGDNEMDELISRTGIEKQYIQQLIHLLHFMRYRPVLLKKLDNVELRHIEGLLDAGFRDTRGMLLSGRTGEDRNDLSRITGIPLDVVERVIRIADLMRLPGVKNIRANLYLEAGLDCVQKFSLLELSATKKYLIEFVEKAKTTRIAPLPKELATQIAWAKSFIFIVDFN